jgi:hypothetical protein
MSGKQNDALSSIGKERASKSIGGLTARLSTHSCRMTESGSPSVLVAVLKSLQSIERIVGGHELSPITPPTLSFMEAKQALTNSPQ